MIDSSIKSYAFDKLKSLDLSKSTVGEIRELLKSISINYIPFNIQKGVYIIRARKGYGYTKRSQMTYCPKDKCKSFQRASLRNETMFYGVLSDDQRKLEHARAIAVAECSSLCRQGITSIGRESFCLAHWEVIKPLRIASLITPSTFNCIKDNLILSQLRDVYRSCFQKENSLDIDLNISNFISEEFSKIVSQGSDEQYLISAIISTILVKEKNFDGIVYPSVQLGGQAGLNIALSPMAVNKKLRFLRVLEHTLYKNRGKSFIRLEKCTEKGLVRKINQISDSDLADRLSLKDLYSLPYVK